MQMIKVKRWQGVTPPLMEKTLFDGLPEKCLKVLFTDPIHGDAVDVHHMIDMKAMLVGLRYEYNMVTDRWECYDGDRFSLPLMETVEDSLVHDADRLSREFESVKARLKRWREFTK